MPAPTTPLSVSAAQAALVSSFDVLLNEALAAGVQVGPASVEPPMNSYADDSKMSMPSMGVSGDQQRANVRSVFRQSLYAILASTARTYQDTTSSPGSATANTDLGRSSVASGSSAMILTNSKITPSSVVSLATESIQVVTYSVVVTNGQAIVNLSSAASGDWVFRWAVLS